MSKVYDKEGKVVGEIKLPEVFSTEYRPDLIKRAVLALQSMRRQPYGTNIRAGKRTSAHYHGMRHSRYTMMNREMARLPRVHGGPPGVDLRARRAPQTRGGRRAHPPKTEKVWKEKINKKEAVVALKSAIAATASDIVRKRHNIPKGLELPIIFKDDIQGIKKTSELKKVMVAMEIKSELERAKKKKVRAGKGKMRGRKYKTKKSFLLVVGKDEGIVKALSNISSAEVCNIKNLNVEMLAPGAKGGRLTLWTESAINYLGERYG
ncbi:MAG: 50S ribosomal protein L4 [Candidatus Aenigmatarchaeota archaeon]